MAYFAVWFYLFSFMAIHSFGNTHASTWPENLATEFPFSTPDPMNLITASAELYRTATPLQLTVGAFKQFNLTNTGYGIEVEAVNPSSSTKLTGGILGQAQYQFILAYYFWSNSSTAPASNYIDSNGASIQIRAYFANLKYGGCLEEALKYRDGVVGSVANCQVEGYIDSVSFEPFAAELKKIQKPGSSTTSLAPPLFFWYNEAFLDGYYYAYPGAYFNPLDVTKQYPATIIEYPKSSQPGISIPQLESFFVISNANTVMPKPADKRPIVEVAGIIEGVLPLP